MSSYGAEHAAKSSRLLEILVAGNCVATLFRSSSGCAEAKFVAVVGACQPRLHDSFDTRVRGECRRRMLDIAVVRSHLPRGSRPPEVDSSRPCRTSVDGVYRRIISTWCFEQKKQDVVGESGVAGQTQMIGKQEIDAGPFDRRDQSR